MFPSFFFLAFVGVHIYRYIQSHVLLLNPPNFFVNIFFLPFNVDGRNTRNRTRPLENGFSVILGLLNGIMFRTQEVKQALYPPRQITRNL